MGHTHQTFERAADQRPGLHAALAPHGQQRHGGHGGIGLGVVHLHPHAQHCLITLAAHPPRERTGARQACAQAVLRYRFRQVGGLGLVEKVHHLREDNFGCTFANGAVKVRMFGCHQKAVESGGQALPAKSTAELALRFMQRLLVEQHVVGPMQQHDRHAQISTHVFIGHIDVLAIGIYQVLVLHALGAMQKHTQIGATKVQVQLLVRAGAAGLAFDELVMPEQTTQKASHAFAGGAVGLVHAQVVLVRAALGLVVMEAGKQTIHQRVQTICLGCTRGEIDKLQAQRIHHERSDLQAHLRGDRANHIGLELREQHGRYFGFTRLVHEMSAQQCHGRGR